MNLALWFVSGVFVSTISSISQKWSVDRLRPEVKNASRYYLISGIVFRLLISAVIMFLAMRAGFVQIVLCIIGIFLGKWMMLFFWLKKPKRLIKCFEKRMN